MNSFKRFFARFFSKKHCAESAASPGLVCKEIVELVTDYLENALLPEIRVQFEEHIAGCDGCSHYLEQVRLTIGMLRTLAQEPAFPATKEDLLQVFRQWKEHQ
jgi:predicted anti-sigma-YlaC factor YlaD